MTYACTMKWWQWGTVLLCTCYQINSSYIIYMHMVFGNLQSNIVSLFTLDFIVYVPVPVMGYTRDTSCNSSPYLCKVWLISKQIKLLFLKRKFWTFLQLRLHLMLIPNYSGLQSEALSLEVTCQVPPTFANKFHIAQKTIAVANVQQYEGTAILFTVNHLSYSPYLDHQ